jgi:hypothetical protein
MDHHWIITMITRPLTTSADVAHHSRPVREPHEQPEPLSAYRAGLRRTQRMTAIEEE